MLRPGYRISVGGRTVDSTSQPRASTVTALTVTLDADSPVGALELRLGQIGGLAPALGDAVTLDLGYASDASLTRVFTGAVGRIEPGIAVNRVLAYDSGEPLLRGRLDRTFLDTTAGAVVKDLAGRAGLSMSAPDSGVDLPAYVVDSRRSFAEHIRELAALSGVDCYVTADGELLFAAFSGPRTVHELRYGADVLDLRIDRHPAPSMRVEAWGAGPGGARGDDSWAWLAKNLAAHRGVAGTGDLVRLLQRAALRSSQGTATAAMALRDRLVREAVRGRVRVLGNPAVRLGDAVRLSDTPGGGDDGTYRIRSVEHRLGKDGGFLTTIGFTAMQGTATGGTTAGGAA